MKLKKRNGMRLMDKKIIFIDVDGTLLVTDGYMPDSAPIAIKKARENGHKVFLCTGRSLPELSNYILEIGFDGFVSANGCYVEVGGESVFHKIMAEDEIKEMVDFFEENNIGYFLESNTGVFPSKNCLGITKRIVLGNVYENDTNDYEIAMKAMGWFTRLDDKYNIDNCDLKFVNKITFVNDTVKYDDLLKKWGEKYYMHKATIRYLGLDSGEIGLKGINKGSGIQIVLDKIGGVRENTVAYGDSHNDLEMFMAVNYKVAMGNAIDEIKNLADEVTLRPEEDGIYKSFLKNGFI